MYALNYQPWQTKMIELIKENVDEKQQVKNEWRAKVKGLVDGKLMKKAMAFGNDLCQEVTERGVSCLNNENPLDEVKLLRGAEVFIKFQIPFHLL